MTSLDQFKERTEGLRKAWQDDNYLEMWMQAYDNDVDMAEQQFKKTMEFREKMGADTITDTYDPPQVLKQYYAGGFVGHDKTGSPVKVELLGGLDMRGLMRAVTVSDLQKNKLRDTEFAVSEMRQRGAKIGMTAIVDMAGVGREWLWPPGINMYIRLANIVEDSYPGIIKKLFVVNAPAIFPMLWKLARHVLNDRIRSKIEVLGGVSPFKKNRSRNQTEVLLQHIEADQLPAYLGGTLTDADGDGRCPSKICQGGKVPVDQYLSAQTDPESDMPKTSVAAKGSFKLSFTVEQPGAIITYEFRTDDHDISFSVRHVDHDDVTTEVEASRRVQSHLVMEDGTVVCDKLGEYEIIFDNTFSVMTPKNLHYRVILHQTDDVTEGEVNLMKN